MNFLKGKRVSKRFVAAALVVLVLAIIAGACVIYVREYYRADLEAVEAFAPMDSLTWLYSRK